MKSNIFLQQTKQTSHNQFPVQPLSISLFQLHLKSFPNFNILHFQDILTNKESRMFIRKHFCAFIRYLEELDPDLTNITSYMRKLDTFLFRILSVISQIIQQFLVESCLEYSTSYSIANVSSHPLKLSDLSVNVLKTFLPRYWMSLEWGTYIRCATAMPNQTTSCSERSLLTLGMTKTSRTWTAKGWRRC